MEKKFRILTLVLIFSGALNIGLIAAFIFLNLKNTELSLPIVKMASKEKKDSAPNGQILGEMARLSFRELVSFLTNKDPVEEGYTKRDLALAALVSFHHFNLEKALGASPVQLRKLTVTGDQTVDVFPGLNEEQFEAIIRYAYQEKWPLTAKGLFFLLQKNPSPNESLEQAFLLTSEFHALQTLFQKSAAPQETATLLSLAREGNWDILEKLAQQQAHSLDFSVDKRRALLLQYTALRSATAAQILLSTDFLFALKRMDDRGILELLDLLKKQTEVGTRFCTELLRSPRSDAIWQMAALTLYTWAGESSPASLDPKAALARFASSPPPQPVAAGEKPSRFHVVKEGENLWKIARQYKVKVDELVRLNGLEKDSLFPGMTLKLPQGTGSEPPR